MAYDVNVPDPFVGMDDSILKFEIRLVAGGSFPPFPARGLIVWMNMLEEFFESRYRPSGVEPQHAVALLRPVPGICERFRGPTAGLAQSLRFRQICFAFT